jgi:ParB family chromosome partitioning protein
MKSRSAQKIKLTSYDELLGGNSVNEVGMEIEISKIYPFENHPFRVVDDERMQDLVESIKKNGIVSPVLLRPDDEGTYEMISGHRRMFAAKKIGLRTLPAIIRNMTDDEATIYMVDANIQRVEILPSEKAFAYKMKMDAISRQGKRPDATSRHNVGKFSCEEIGDDAGVSGRTINRYIRLTELVPELLELVDQGKLQVTPAVDVSYFPVNIQEWLCEYIKVNGSLKADQVARLKRELRQDDQMTQETMIAYLNANYKFKESKNVTISQKKLDEFFPLYMSSTERERIILKLLEQWKREQGGF